MCKRQSISLPQGSLGFVVCCTLLLAACSDESGRTLADVYPVPGEPSSSLPPIVDQSDDTLMLPHQPTLTVSAQTGSLNFQWQAVKGQRRARLYRHDPQAGGETLTHEFDDPTASHWQLPSQTHARAWHRQQYRVELCTVDDCVSSPRMPLTGLAPYTIDSMSPAVFIQGERHAEQLALNHDATLAVLTLPVEGAVEIQARIGEQWTLLQRLRLDRLAISMTRTLDVALSHSGDTLAVLIRDSEAPAEQDVRIVERLGEAWLETAAWPVTGAMAVKEQAYVKLQTFPDKSHAGIALSSLGDQLLLRVDQILMHYQQTESGWSEVPSRLNVGAAQGFIDSSNSARLMASAHNADFTRIFTLIEDKQQLYLSVWTPSGHATSWQNRGYFPVQGLQADAPLSIISDTSGVSVVVAGWEDIRSEHRTPMMWRYGVELVPSDTPAEPAFRLTMMDSLRAPATGQANPVLVFTADGSLSLVALGWHSAGVSTSAANVPPDAVLSTYRYDFPTRQWLSALELPDTLPTLARQSFAAETVLSADGRTMLMSGTPGSNNSSSSRASTMLVMR